MPTLAQRTRQRGFALLAVLWLTTLLALVAASFTTTARTEIQLGRNAVLKAKAEALADAGVHLAVLALLQPDPDERWRADGTVYTLAFGTGEIRVSIQDEAGKLDLNVASDELLHGLLLAVGLDADEAVALVDAIADFREPGDLRRLHGATAPDYRAAGLAWGPKGAPFAAVEELQQVLGMTPTLYRRLAPLVTVHSWERGIDPATAPPEVLLALPGIAPVQVEWVLAARADAAAGLDPEALAEAPDAAVGEEQLGGERGGRLERARPSARQRLLERRRQRARRARPAGDVVAAVQPLLAGFEAFLTVSGGWIFSIRAEARSEGGGVFVREAVVALTQRPDQPYRFLVWKRSEGGPTAEP